MMPPERGDMVKHRVTGQQGVVDCVRGSRCWVEWYEGNKTLGIEVCDESDLIPDPCEKCGELECWCGVGR